MESIVGIRYATSLLELGLEENCLDGLFEELQGLRQVFDENPDFLKLLSTPVIAKAEKIRMLTQVFAGKISPYLQNLMEILVDKSRFSSFMEIAEEFRRLYNKHNNIQETVATTAIPLSAELAKKLTAKLETITGKKILLQNRVDPSILGGVIIQMDNDQLDDSVRARIDRLKKQISATTA